MHGCNNCYEACGKILIFSYQSICPEYLTCFIYTDYLFNTSFGLITVQSMGILKTTQIIVYYCIEFSCHLYKSKI